MKTPTRAKKSYSCLLQITLLEPFDYMTETNRNFSKPLFIKLMSSLKFLKCYTFRSTVPNHLVTTDLFDSVLYPLEFVLFSLE